LSARRSQSPLLFEGSNVSALAFDDLAVIGYDALKFLVSLSNGLKGAQNVVFFAHGQLLN
jgi:hypothetical protein